MSDHGDSHEYYAPDEYDSSQEEFEAELDKIPVRLFAKRIQLSETAKTNYEIYVDGLGSAGAANAAAQELTQFDTDHPEVMAAVNYWDENPSVKE